MDPWKNQIQPPRHPSPEERVRVNDVWACSLTDITVSRVIVASVQHKQHGVPALKVLTNNFEVKSSTYYSVTLDASCLMFLGWILKVVSALYIKGVKGSVESNDVFPACSRKTPEALLVPHWDRLRDVKDARLDPAKVQHKFQARACRLGFKTLSWIINTFAGSPEPKWRQDLIRLGLWGHEARVTD